MADTGTNAEVYVVPVDRVREAVGALLERRVHTYFIAYLHLRKRSAETGSLTGIQQNLSELGDVLRVSGGPPRKPFLRPFWADRRDANQEWLNENLAGSYGPSSLRGTPLKVVQVDSDGTFTLPEGHWSAAREHLLYGQQIPALALASFLFRDRGVIATEPPDAQTLIQIFRFEYGYWTEDQEEFEFLYDGSWSGVEGTWFELIDGEYGQ